MKYTESLELGQKAILEKLPEFQEATFVADNSGWANFAIKVNNEYLFRFPRDDEAYGCIQAECAVLGKLKTLLPDYVQVPDYLGEFLNQDYPFVYYKMIQGEPLTHALWNELSDDKRNVFIDNLAEFLEILHSLSLENCKIDTIKPLENYQKRYQEFKEKCFKYLNPEEQVATKKLFTNYFNNSRMQTYTPAIIHHDLSENHILLTKNGIGILDFGDTVVFDPAMDFTWMYMFDKELYQKLYDKYQSSKKDADFELRIRDFYIPIIPFYGIIYGEETRNSQLLKTELQNLKQNLARFI